MKKYDEAMSAPTRAMSSRPLFLLTLLVSSTLVYASPHEEQVAGLNPPGFGEYRPGVVETAPLSNSPFSLSERKLILDEREHQLSKGWTPDTEGQVGTFQFYFDQSGAFYERGKRTLEESLPYLQIAPASFDETSFEDAELHTVMHAGGYVDGAWTGLIRVMTVPEIGQVVLEEYDYIAAGSHITIAEEIVDSTINGKPSLFTIWKGGAAQDAAVTEMEWFTDRKHFRLLVRGAVDPSTNAYQQLITLAETLQ